MSEPSELGAEQPVLARKRPGRWSLVYAVPVLVAGAGLGYFGAALVTFRVPQRFPELLAAQQDHARVMFCHAPTAQSLRVVREYEMQAAATGDEATPYAVELLAERAILEERSSPASGEETWKKAERACGAAGLAACGREALRSLAEAGCEKR